MLIRPAAAYLPGLLPTPATPLEGVDVADSPLGPGRVE